MTVAAVLSVGPLAGSAHAATSLTLTAAPARVVVGATTTLSGTAAPAGVPSEPFLVMAQTDAGGWAKVADVTTAADGSGAWSLAVSPSKNTSFRIQSADGTVMSTPVEVGVAPKLQIATRGAARAFYPVTVRVSVLPRTFTGKVRVRLDGAGTALASTTINVRNGVGQKSVTPKGAGRFRVRGTTSAADWDDTFTSTRLVVTGRTLRAGMRGPDARGLQSRLAKLGFLTPRTGDKYTFSASEVTVAFQKWYGLPRTYVWGSREWKKLASLNTGPKPRFNHGRAAHVEVDKSKQTLMVAKGGRVLGIMAVSTGRSGNTPVGTFRIYQRGGSYLYRFLAFKGNFGIHGYPSVPANPASAGCVREPNWAASFTWNNTKMGSPVHVTT